MVGLTEQARLARLKLIAQLDLTTSDPDAAHFNAEKLLLEYLEALGDRELANAWRQAKDVQEWWYA